MTKYLPAVLETPSCGGPIASEIQFEIKSVSSNILQEDVFAAVSLDEEKAAVTVDTQDFSFVGQDIVLIIGIKSTNSDISKTGDLILTISLKADSLEFDLSAF